MSPLCQPDHSYDRRAIMAFAWSEYRSPLNRPGMSGRQTFGQCLAYAWQIARSLRARMVDGSYARQQAEYAARETLRQQLEASLSLEEKAAQWALIAYACSTDGRLPETHTGA